MARFFRKKRRNNNNHSHNENCCKEPTLSDEERERSSPILQQSILAREGGKSLEENALPVSAVSNWEEIAEIVNAALKQAETLGNKRVEAYALGYLGGVFQQMGNFLKAQDLTEQALELAHFILWLIRRQQQSCP